MEYKQVKSVNIERVAFLAHARDMPTHQDVHTSAVELNKNAQREITENTNIPQRVLNLQMLILK